MVTATISDFLHVACTETKPARVILSVPYDGLWAHNFADCFSPRTQGVIIKGADRYVTPIVNDVLRNCEAHRIGAQMSDCYCLVCTLMLIDLLRI